MRALLSMDFLISLLLSSLALILILSAFFLSASSLAHQLSQIERERDAIYMADMLLSACPSNYGLADCSKGFLKANVISKEALFALKKILPNDLLDHLGLLTERKFRIILIADGGTDSIISTMPPDSGTICVKRLAVLDEAVAIIKLCA